MTDDKIKRNQQVIPEAALRDEAAVEMLRVWIAERDQSVRVAAENK